ncbi:c61f45c2-68b7-4f1e-8120-d096496d56a9 [Sclerotinia trifoliorum]|uniref:C61f45c2-68b7-4f1e-8120-d096496d56a9 n=1 Tax=Sclerotinia trifoliorum TaxID=28548 RepID=A0A8H2ZJY6_9HELO|nr:c61f45c2-68b7-4f1e-8120-d096496d56a9 [Sclerotinia trifoliorum]
MDITTFIVRLKFQVITCLSSSSSFSPKSTSSCPPNNKHSSTKLSVLGRAVVHIKNVNFAKILFGIQFYLSQFPSKWSKEYAPEATKKWNSFAGNSTSQKSQAESQSAHSATQSKTKALIRVDPEVLLSDTMGMETIVLKVGAADDGQGTMVFSIHKNLLMSSSPRFVKMLNSRVLDRNQIYSIHDTSPSVFKLFNEYLYTRRVPGVSHRLSQSAQGTRISELCQLYVFAEIFEMDRNFLNKIMDAIQDGLALSSSLLTYALVKNIFDHAQSESPLRKFCAANALYSAMTPGLDSAGFQWLIKNSDEFFAEFMKMLVKLTKGNDPRIRDVNQEYFKEVKVKEEELEAGGVPVGANIAVVVGPGVHPCQFHVHAGSGSDTEGASGVDDDEICYLLAGLDV